MRDRAESIRRLMRSFTEIPFQQLRDAMEGKVEPADGPPAVAEFARQIAELIDENVAFEVRAVKAYTVTWPRGEGRGFDEWLAMWAGWFDSWESIDVAHGELFEVGDTVVQEFKGHLVGRGSGMELNMHHFQLWRFDGDRVVEFRIEPSRDAAVAVAQGRRHPG